MNVKMTLLLVELTATARTLLDLTYVTVDMDFYRVKLSQIVV